MTIATHLFILDYGPWLLALFAVAGVWISALLWGRLGRKGE